MKIKYEDTLGYLCITKYAPIKTESKVKTFVVYQNFFIWVFNPIWIWIYGMNTQIKIKIENMLRIFEAEQNLLDTDKKSVFVVR